jgi:hypothetical protein
MPGHKEAIKSTPTIAILILLSFVCICLLSSCGSYKNIKLTSAAKEALRENPNIDYTKLVCNVSEGIAYLSGTVYTEKERELAEEIVRGVEGITDVRNTIKIEEGGETNPVMLSY